MKYKRVLSAVMACVMAFGMGSIPIKLVGSQSAELVANAEELEYTEGTYGDLTYVKWNTFVRITGCDKNAISVEIPSEIDGVPVTSIGYKAFSECAGLTSIIIPDSMTNIDSKAFSRCTALTSIAIPEAVTSIGEEAFFGCTGLTSITIPEAVTSIGDDAFSATPWLAEKQKENPLVIVNHILISGGNCSGAVIIPEGVTSISGNAFNANRNFTSVTIPNSVKNIGAGAFYFCNVKSIIIPDGVENIKGYTFYASELTSVTLPNSVTNIESGAFGVCNSLTDVYYTGTEEQWNAITIESDNESLGNATIHFNSSAPEQPVEELEISVASVIDLNKTFKARKGAPKKYDLNGDNVVNVIDLALLKQKLLNK